MKMTDSKYYKSFKKQPGYLNSFGDLIWYYSDDLYQLKTVLLVIVSANLLDWGPTGLSKKDTYFKKVYFLWSKLFPLFLSTRKYVKLLLHVSVIYLPALFVIIILDSINFLW